MQPAWPAPPPHRRSIWIWLGPLLGLCTVLGLTLFVSVIRFCSQASEAGSVLAANEVPQSALDRVNEKKLLQPTEKLVCYYDATISGDGSEISLLTTERLVYSKDGRTTAFSLADIADVRHRTDSFEGDIIEAQTDSGELMTVTIAPLNNGPKFLSALESVWKTKRKAP